MDRETRLKRLKFRSWHRGTREADMMIGSFFDTQASGWNEREIDWFERFLEEQDVDIMAWALRVQNVPDHWQDPMMEAFQRLDYMTPPA